MKLQAQSRRKEGDGKSTRESSVDQWELQKPYPIQCSNPPPLSTSTLLTNLSTFHIQHTLTQHKNRRTRSKNSHSVSQWVSEMASTACFLHHHVPTTTSKTPAHRLLPNLKSSQLVCKAQKQEPENNATVSRRLALTILIGTAAVGSKVSPADAAYGESGIVHLFSLVSNWYPKVAEIWAQ